jgi:non-specific serine/threonine protein kinase
MRIFAGLGHRRGIARALEGFACLALAEGHAERALKLAGAAGRLRESIGAPLHHEEKIDLDQALVPAWTRLGEAESRRAWDEGSSMSVESALEYALSAAARST